MSDSVSPRASGDGRPTPTGRLPGVPVDTGLVRKAVCAAEALSANSRGRATYAECIEEAIRAYLAAVASVESPTPPEAERCPSCGTTNREDHKDGCGVIAALLAAGYPPAGPCPDHSAGQPREGDEPRLVLGTGEVVRLTDGEAERVSAILNPPAALPIEGERHVLEISTVNDNDGMTFEAVCSCGWRTAGHLTSSDADDAGERHREREALRIGRAALARGATCERPVEGEARGRVFPADGRTTAAKQRRAEDEQAARQGDMTAKVGLNPPDRKRVPVEREHEVTSAEQRELITRLLYRWRYPDLPWVDGGGRNVAEQADCRRQAFSIMCDLAAARGTSTDQPGGS